MERLAEDMMGWGSTGLFRYSVTRLFMNVMVCDVRVNSRLSRESINTQVANSLGLTSSTQLPAPSTPSLQRRTRMFQDIKKEHQQDHCLTHWYRRSDEKWAEGKKVD